MRGRLLPALATVLIFAVVAVGISAGPAVADEKLPSKADASCFEMPQIRPGVEPAGR